MPCCLESSNADMLSFAHSALSNCLVPMIQRAECVKILRKLYEYADKWCNTSTVYTLS
jgi:hypothetical protein